MTNNEALPKNVQIAWQAYQNMSASKNTYYDFLQSLQQKYETSGEPSEYENRQLENMLKAHSKTVAAFSDVMQALTDPDERALLLKNLNHVSNSS